MKPKQVNPWSEKLAEITRERDELKVECDRMQVIILRLQVYLSDARRMNNSASHKVKRKFYCDNCKCFQDVRENQNDIVCNTCNWIIAIYEDNLKPKRRQAALDAAGGQE